LLAAAAGLDVEAQKKTLGVLVLVVLEHLLVHLVVAEAQNLQFLGSQQQTTQ
jgi:hypothetical protein